MVGVNEEVAEDTYLQMICCSDLYRKLLKDKKYFKSILTVKSHCFTCTILVIRVRNFITRNLKFCIYIFLHMFSYLCLCIKTFT